MFREVSVHPQDVLDAAHTLALDDEHRCNWLTHWDTPATSGEWARRGLSDGDDYGLSNAVTYAKHAAACRIDVLVLYNHLSCLTRATYPAKIEGLRRIGVAIPDVVWELVIDPRNDLEHGYQIPDITTARRAVDVCELFRMATADEYKQGSVVAVGWNASTAFAMGVGPAPIVKFHQFLERPMLFVDVFAAAPAAKIVDPKSKEVRLAELRAFELDQAVALANLLRGGSSSTASRSVSHFWPGYYTEVKSQAGF